MFALPRPRITPGRSAKARGDVVAEETDLLHRVVLVHAGSLEAQDEVVSRRGVGRGDRGLASLKAGDNDGARRALSAALKSPGPFAGKDDARKALAELE